MATLQTDFNTAPFYDDFDENKQYYRILFRPSTAVQARELTQLQTILQNQISRFGSTIYKEGSVVEGCTFAQFPNLDQVKFKDSNSSTLDFTTVTADSYDPTLPTSHLKQSHLLVSNTTGVRAVVFEAFSGAESAVSAGSNDTNRAYVIYIRSGRLNGVQVDKFSQTSEQIDVYTTNQDRMGILNGANLLGQLYTLSSNSSVNALGVGYGIHVSQGIIYQKGFFLKTNAGNFVIKEHTSNAAGIKVGFNTAESIIKPAADSSLYDNSAGSTNYSAPGAYRLKLSPSLVSYDTTNTQIIVPKDFLPVVDFSGGTGAPTQIQQDPLLSTIGDILAKRTKEESGDYIVTPFQVNVEESSNTQTLYYTVSPGTAYIDGYRIEYTSPKRIEVNRGINTDSLDGEIVTANFGNYLIVNQTAGIFDIGNLQQVNLYDQPQQVLTVNPGTTGVLGNQIGTATVKAIKWYSGEKGTANGQYLLYINNISMLPNKSFASTKSVYVNGTYGRVYADIVPDPITGKTQLYEPNNRSLIFDTGLQGMKRLTSNTGVNATSFIYRITSDPVILTRTSPGATATFTIGSDQYDFGPTTITDTLSENVNVMFNTDTIANAFPTGVFGLGTVAATNSTISTVTFGVSTDFLGQNLLRIGETLKFTGPDGPYYYGIANVNSATSINVYGPLTLSGQYGINRFYKTGTFINFNGQGNAITFAATAGRVNQMTINLAIDPDTSSTFSVRAQAPIIRNAAVPVEKVVKKDVFVKIDCTSHTNGAAGPWSLGIPDVYKLTAVYTGASFSTSNPDRKDWFTFNNGQTDNLYDLASISVNPKYKTLITSSTKMLLQFSHFSPNVTTSKAGFFSVDSYHIDDANTLNTSAIATAEIPVYKSIDGTVYDLRNYIDFRPVKQATATSTQAIASASINPSASSSSYYTAAGALLSMEPDSNFVYNAEHYLPRYDALLITKDGYLVVRSSTSSYNPKPPVINNTGLQIASIYMPPYPSLTFTEAE